MHMLHWNKRLQRAGLSLALVAMAVGAAPAALAMSEQEADAAVARLMKSAEYKALSDLLDKDHDNIVEQNIQLQQIPAPPFGEEKKAKAFAALMKEAGLDAKIDEEGNVLALWEGTGKRKDVHAVIAHIDTVFPLEQDLTIRREGTRILAPGIADDTRGLVALLAYVRAMKQAGIQTEENLLFVGSVGEEGLGDLRGVKHLFGKGEYKDRITSAIIVDGSNPEQVTLEGPGSKRYEVHFKGPGGHSYRAFGMVNPMYALGNAMAEFGKVEAPKGTTYSVGVVGGGTSVNAIPGDAWMLVDMRSTSMKDLASVEQQFLGIIKAAADQENKARNTKTGPIALDYKLVGDRPPGQTAEDHRLAQIALAATRAQGWKGRPNSSSTDGNIPMSMNIPTVGIGAGVGDHAHSAEKEYLDVEKGQSLRALHRPLLTILDAAKVQLR